MIGAKEAATAAAISFVLEVVYGVLEVCDRWCVVVGARVAEFRVGGAFSAGLDAFPEVSLLVVVFRVVVK